MQKQGNKQRCVLIIDDDAPFAIMLSQRLQIWDFKTVVCTSPIDAIKVFRKSSKTFDLVISDLQMPGMNGDELAVELLVIRADIAIIICSGGLDEDVCQKLFACGVRECISKPLSPNTLISALKSALT